MTSPYRAVLGAAFDELHPRLRTYFDAIPAGAVGRGSGVFETVGTPRRWLWPVLAGFARAHVMFPVWERDVRFTVTNRAVVAGDGSPAVAAVRSFELRGGRGSGAGRGGAPGSGCDRGGRRGRSGRSALMIDEIGVSGGVIIDRLGDPVLADALFRATVRNGALRLRSTAVRLVIAGRRVAIPRIVAPVVVLTERWDDETECQCVSIVVGMPVIGRIYQYNGRFRYGIEEGEQAE